MNIEYCKRVMHSCLVQTVMFKHVPQKELLAILKGVIVLLADKENLSKEEQEECLMYFWKEYNMGATTPMSDSYIRNTLIPIVMSYSETDIAWALTILTMA